MALCVRKAGIDWVVIAGALSWAVLCVVWLLSGSGYQFINPAAYGLTTRILLSNPETAPDASKAIEAQGYLSLLEQRRLSARIAALPE
ncbi:hypothetical protein NPS53_08865 [Pseudomonas putida]|uniref:hypothetical protein n=1 Tax=Pseudomonas putida TaxID=303 RepID=UPI0023647A7B|nr:hypothetical protein [Pseudomonas putida]MDD2139685.1 hypothetical protein [Pseudomonas putida]HDS1721609.1 hypothetical protein [Pseudomonas putida]